MKILGLNIIKDEKLVKGVKYQLQAQQEESYFIINLYYEYEGNKINSRIDLKYTPLLIDKPQYVPKKDLNIPDLIPQDLDSPTVFENDVFLLHLGDARDKDTIEIHMENFICQS